MDLMQYMDLSDESKQRMYREHLKADVSFGLATSGATFANIRALIKKSTELDNSLFEFKRIHGTVPGFQSSRSSATVHTTHLPSPRKTPAPSAPSGSTPASTSTPDPDRMDATKTCGRSTDDERAEHRRKGLCLYCASPDHKIADCPAKPSGNNTARK